MTGHTTPCTVLTAIAGWPVCVDEFDSLAEASQFIADGAGDVPDMDEEPEPFFAPRIEDDDYLVRPWVLEGWSRAEYFYDG